MPGGWEWLIILIVALLIFGKRLPEVMKSLGRGIVEFKKGVKGVEEDVEEASSKTTQKKIETEKDVTKQESK
jgi:sec-independent protein translocase protein TatA